ncbi:hypothetical protein DM02DRAFT_608157 [Periconia macrospinosa]|uniref:Uncharacterized protein n=1 Tax=Periconia macrospinosa TaxID=97972 RepID=A0A2V1EED6_9PLEO|nr:hypothetical protein DM02DRAFT_608157 [Periconia macrospinosa]
MPHRFKPTVPPPNLPTADKHEKKPEDTPPYTYSNMALARADLIIVSNSTNGRDKNKNIQTHNSSS